MEDQLAGLEEAITALRTVWAGAGAVAGPAEGLDRVALIGVSDALGAVGRRLDGVRALVAAQIDRQSRPELGPESLAKQHGYRTPAALIAATGGISTGDATRLTRLGNAVVPRATLTGEPLPARRPHVAAAVTAGRLGAAAAGLIVGMLDRIGPRATADAVDHAEHTLVDRAPGLPLDAVRHLITRVEAWLDPDGQEPAEYDRRTARYLRLYERDGYLHLDGKLDTLTGAPIKTAIDALVTAGFRAATTTDTVAGDDPDRTTVVQRQADALVHLAEHALGCDRPDLPLDGATMVVRIALTDLQAGTGLGEIDGITQPVSAGAARRLATSCRILPAVLGAGSEVLDWGRTRRLFTPAQRLALVERDGGCAMCHLPPGMTKAHHLDWWAKDDGPTDLNNGILLCEACHHRIHDNQWEIRIDGQGLTAKVWFLPPPHLDPTRTPRLGSRARYDHPHAA